MNLTKEFLKMLRGAWLLIVLWVAGWLGVIWLVGHYVWPHVEKILNKLER